MASDIGHLAGLDRTALRDLMRAAIELAVARLRLDSARTRALVAAPPDKIALKQRHVPLVERVAFAIPRVAARLPWRADCLVQALAAKRWLERKGVSTVLTLGVRKDMPDDFEAHAWLTAGDRVVTGGDIGGYVPLVRPASP